MLSITDELKELFKTDYLPYRDPVSKQLYLKFNDGLIITNNQIVSESLSLEESLCSGNNIEFGACESTMMKISVADLTEDITNKEFELYIVVSSTTIKLGKFIVESSLKQDNQRFRSVTAYDYIRKFNREVIDWYNALTFPISVKAMRNSLCTYCGIEYEDSNLPNDTMNVEQTISANTLNGLDVLKKLEEINGCMGHMNRDGKLCHIVLGHSAVDTIPGNAVKKITFEEYRTDPISKVQIHQEDGDIGAYSGTGTNCYAIQGNFLVYGKSAASLQTIADNIASNILGIEYRSYDANIQGLPYLRLEITLLIVVMK
jgi:hypothetical protein